MGWNEVFTEELRKSRGYCPFCQKAIDVLQKAHAKDMHVEQIENNPFMEEIQDYLQKKTGARSVPRVFIGGEFIGGGDDTVFAGRAFPLQENLFQAPLADLADLGSSTGPLLSVFGGVRGLGCVQVQMMRWSARLLLRLKERLTREKSAVLA